MPTTPAEAVKYYELEPLVESGSKNWYSRCQNFAIVYSEFESGARFEVANSENEYFIILMNGSLDVTTEKGSGHAGGTAEIIVPPGESSAVATSSGKLARVFAPVPGWMESKIINNASYAEPHHNVAPLVLWPEPVDGYKLRIYEYSKLPAGSRLMWRSRNIMVNWRNRPTPTRDPHNLSPHKHDDFEQGSLCVTGKYIHHLRYPWEADSTTWLPDERMEIDTPCLAIMPPPALHTAQGIAEFNDLIDIFAPPRVDFSTSGLVLAENAAAYPMPDDIGGEMKSGENCQIEGIWQMQCDDKTQVKIAKGDLFPICPEHKSVGFRIVTAIGA